MPYQDAPSPPMTPELSAACRKAVHVITRDGQVLRAGRAALFMLDACGWTWRVRVLRLPPLIWLVELGYYVVSKNRRVFARFMFRKE